MWVHPKCSRRKGWVALVSGVALRRLTVAREGSAVPVGIAHLIRRLTSRTDGQVSILTDDMEVAGELVQDMCAYLTITEQVLNSGRFGH